MGAGIFAVIPAAGSGSRMGQLSESASKVLLSLGESTILRLALRSIVASGVVDGGVVLCREADMTAVKAAVAEESRGLELRVALGGKTRQESVHRGLELLDGRAEYVLVHDAARPFCSPEAIREVSKVGVDTGAAILALPVKPTLKLVESDLVSRTIPREGVWEAQTPQVFSHRLLYQASLRALSDGFHATDDASLVERLGEKVSVVRGEERNIKITTRADLDLAAFLLDRAVSNTAA